MAKSLTDFFQPILKFTSGGSKFQFSVHGKHCFLEGFQVLVRGGRAGGVEAKCEFFAGLAWILKVKQLPSHSGADTDYF